MILSHFIWNLDRVIEIRATNQVLVIQSIANTVPHLAKEMDNEIDELDQFDEIYKSKQIRNSASLILISILFITSFNI